MASLSSRRSFVQTLSLLGCGLPLITSCVHEIRQQRAHRIGFVIGADYPQLVTAFKGELRRLGYVEGGSFVVEMRESQPDQSDLPEMCAELARMDLKLIVAAALSTAIEVRKANSAIPMVIATCPGMVSNGFAQTLEHPGGNVTGIDELPPGLTTKRLTLLKTAAPGVSHVALLSTTPGHGGHEMQLADAEQSATALGIKVVPYRATSLGELQRALTAIVSDGMDGLLNFQGGLSLTNRQLIVDFAATHRLPAVYQATLFAEAGGLMAWAPNLPNQFRMAARYVDQILRGADPGNLPIQFPTRYYLTLNAGAAKGLGVALPPALIDLADRVVT
ncbi:MAG: ABC transporter substrate-binding protein [Pseudomonadota bacterium]|nr:ABC transporter substrate-binding protein [Pseudomonadota bacterium]